MSEVKRGSKRPREQQQRPAQPAAQMSDEPTKEERALLSKYEQLRPGARSARPARVPSMFYPRSPAQRRLASSGSSRPWRRTNGT